MTRGQAIVMAPPIQVVPLNQLRRQRLDGQVDVIADATGEPPLTLKALARLAVLRRRIRACGGDLVLVAGPETRELLERCRLETSIPCEGTIAEGVHALRVRYNVGATIPHQTAPDQPRGSDG